jgi:uncharacterized protein (TIGR03382 family)
VAQTITLSFPASATTLAYGLPGCNNSVRVTWTATGFGSSACNSLQLWVANGQACADSPGTSATDGGTDLILGTFSLNTQTTGTGDFVVSNMPGVTGKNCNDAIDVKNYVCASVQYRTTVGGNCSTAQATPNLVIRYDNVPPDPPTISADGLDGKISVHFAYNGSGASDVLNWLAEYGVEPPGGGDPAVWNRTSQISTSKTSNPIEGLLNGTTYLVRGYAFDEVSNSSAPSASVEATPEHSSGFWEEYKNDGGQEVGGCSAAGAAVPSAIGVMAVLVALLQRRRP